VAAAALVAASVVVTQAQQQSPRELFERARLLEENSRMLDRAVEMYRQVASQANTDRPLAAAAQLRIGIVQERQGKPEARTVFANIVRDYKDLTAIASTARARLSASASPQLVPDPRRVFDGGYDQPFDISADGRFTVGPEREGYNDGYNGYGIILRDLEGHRVTRLGEGFQARISRNGQRVAMGCSAEKKMWLCVIGTAPGSKPEPIVESTGEREVVPVDWAPGGVSILVAVRRYDERQTMTSLELGWLSLQTKSIQTVRTFEPWQVLGRRLLWSRVSPDGQFVAFVMRPQTNQDHILHVIDRAGENESRMVSSYGAHDYPLWTPDGGHLLFVGTVSGLPGLWSVPVRGGRAAGEPSREQANAGFVGEGDRDNGGSAFVLRPLGMSTAGNFYYSRTSGNVNYEFETNRTVSPGDRPVAFPGIHASWSAHGIAFLRGGGDTDLIIRDSSGIETRHQRSGIDFSRELRWVPDGSGIIVFVHENWDDPQPDGIYVLERRTGAFRRLFDVKANGHWRKIEGGVSPDGKSLYFGVSNTAAGPMNGIVAVDIDTGTERPIMTLVPAAQSSGAAIDLSPDGRTLAVSVPVNTPRTAKIFTVGVDGTGYREVVSSFATGWDNLRWAPDGQSLLFSGSNADTSWRIMRVPVAGGQPVFDGVDQHALQGILPDLKLYPSNFNGFNLSPDGNRIITSTWTMAKHEIWTIDGLLTAVNSR
jgi:Tol biopolymer transport system component